MSKATLSPEGWTEVEKPASLFRRFEFLSYAEARAFLDRLAGLSEETGIFPDLSFTRAYVNVTLRGAAFTEATTAQEFAVRAAALATTDVS